MSSVLKQRIISGVLLGGGVFAIAFGAPVLVVLAFISCFVVLGQAEVYAMLRSGGFPVYRWMGIVLGLVLTVIVFFTTTVEPQQAVKAMQSELTFYGGAILLILVRSLWQHADKKPVEGMAGTLLGIFYIPVLFSFMTRLAFYWTPADSVTKVSSTGVSLCLYLLFVVKFSDIGAFFVGRSVGKHKMFPRVSPKKSWEGAVGGVLSSLVVSLIFWKVVDNGEFGIIQLRIWDAIVLGLILPVVGMVGDLCESQMKRACDVKDSSALIPGMGGVLDVIDSILFGAPVLFFYLVWLVE